MNFLDKMERKFGKYAIPNLINYFIVIYIAGGVLSLFGSNFYYAYLMLDFGKIFQGQIWRLVTFMLEPQALMGGFFNLLFFLITIHLYYLFGHSLENAWGAFRFNVFFLGGVFFNIVAALLLYIFFGAPYYTGISYLYQSMFFAFALSFPDMQFMLYFMIPVKAKWLAIIDAVLIGWNFITYVRFGYWVYAVAILVALGNFLIFFFSNKKITRMSPRQVKRRHDFKKQVRQPMGVTKHKCAICGRTEKDGENMEFRFCSKCEGNYEYCQDHLFTHEHIKHH